MQEGHPERLLTTLREYLSTPIETLLQRHLTTSPEETAVPAARVPRARRMRGSAPGKDSAPRPYGRITGRSLDVTPLQVIEQVVGGEGD